MKRPRRPWVNRSLGSGVVDDPRLDRLSLPHDIQRKLRSLASHLAISTAIQPEVQQTLTLGIGACRSAQAQIAVTTAGDHGTIANM